MSEYQYYEFHAIDRPLSERERRELRACSTRATITSTRLINHYEWGDLKGDPRVWIEKYFDAFLTRRRTSRSRPLHSRSVAARVPAARYEIRPRRATDNYLFMAKATSSSNMLLSNSDAPRCAAFNLCAALDNSLCTLTSSSRRGGVRWVLKAFRNARRTPVGLPSWMNGSCPLRSLKLLSKR